MPCGSARSVCVRSGTCCSPSDAKPDPAPAAGAARRRCRVFDLAGGCGFAVRLGVWGVGWVVGGVGSGGGPGFAGSLDPVKGLLGLLVLLFPGEPADAAAVLDRQLTGLDSVLEVLREFQEREALGHPGPGLAELPGGLLLGPVGVQEPLDGAGPVEGRHVGAVDVGDQRGLHELAERGSQRVVHGDLRSRYCLSATADASPPAARSSCCASRTTRSPPWSTSDKSRAPWSWTSTATSPAACAS